MKTRYILQTLLNLSICNFSNAQTLLGGSSDQNYIVTASPQTELKKNGIINTENSIIKVDYLNNFGEVKQTVMRGITPQKNDLVTTRQILNNSVQLQVRSFLPLPVANNAGQYQTADVILPKAKVFYGDDVPYSTSYSEYNTNLPISLTPEGKSWQNNPVKYSYSHVADRVRKYNVNYNGSLYRLICSEDYPNGSLFCESVLDEDGNKHEKYTDIFGKLILERAYNNNDKHDTYYVYDEVDNLAMVLPPIASDAINSPAVIDENNETIGKYAYIYKI